jgi:hypothetical protein
MQLDQTHNVSISERLEFARAELPHSRLTSWAVVLAAALRGILALVLLPLQLVLMVVWAILSLVTFRLSVLVTSLVFAVPWLLVLALVALSSWLWIRAPLLRGILLVPGALLIAIVNQYLLLVPDDPEGSSAKFELVETWPLTWSVLRPPTLDLTEADGRMPTMVGPDVDSWDRPSEGNM